MSILFRTEANPSNEYRCASGYGGTASISCYLRGPFGADRGGSAQGSWVVFIPTVKNKWLITIVSSC